MAAELTQADCVAIATSAGWHVQPETDFEDNSVCRAFLSPTEPTLVHFGAWGSANDLKPGDVYQWRGGEGASIEPGCWVIVDDDTFLPSTQARVVTLARV